MEFRAILVRSGKTATGFQVPEAVVEALGRGRKPPVLVTLNGTYTYRNSVAVYGGEYWVGVSAEHRAGAGVEAGEELAVGLELDTAERTVDVPDDLAAALAADPAAQAAFGALSYSRQRWYVLSVTDAKTEATRARRVTKAVEQLRAG